VPLAFAAARRPEPLTLEPAQQVMPRPLTPQL
jgi:hypothetical protein